jgi:hypothetical protein
VTKTSSFNLLLLPVPPSVHPSNFRPSRSRLTNQDGTLFGSFQFEPTALDYDYVKEMLVKGKAC